MRQVVNGLIPFCCVAVEWSACGEAAAAAATVTLVCLRHTKPSDNAFWVSSQAREATEEKSQKEEQ